MGGKGGKNQKQDSSYAIRDIVLAKVRGFPPWPGMIVDPENVPTAVGKERPSSKKSNFYCVRFFPAGDYAWLIPKDISKLQTHEIQAYINEPFKRSGDLLSGYRIALDPKPWEEAREAADMDAAEREGNAEVDQLDSENEVLGSGDGDVEKKAAKTTKKRKRESDIVPTKAKAKTKVKKEKDTDEPVATGKKKSAARVKKNGTKSKEVVESEDEAGDVGPEADEDDAGPSHILPPPPAKKVKREKDGEEGDASMEEDPEARKVRDWRHKLQKALLSNKGVPKDDEMPALDHLFTTVESYKNMDIQYLSFSKIGKVMRHIAALPADKVPRDDELHFRDRAKALVDKWHVMLGPSSKTHENGAESGANGVSAAQEPTEAAPQNAKMEPEPEAEVVVKTNGDVEVEVQVAKDEVPPAPVEAEGEAEAEAEDEAEGDDVDMSKEEAHEGDMSALGDVTMSEA